MKLRGGKSSRRKGGYRTPLERVPLEGGRESFSSQRYSHSPGEFSIFPEIIKD